MKWLKKVAATPPNTQNNATVFTRVFAGGWSLNSFDEKVSELCADYGVPYVDWKH